MASLKLPRQKKDALPHTLWIMIETMNPKYFTFPQEFQWVGEAETLVAADKEFASWLKGRNFTL